MPKHTHTQIEEWRDIPGWEDYYQVSDHGRVRSLDRDVARTDGRSSRIKGRILRPGVSKSGRDRYPRVGFSRGGQLHMQKVHLLVAEAFLGERPPGMVCRHLNDNQSDNRVSNLAWGTASENQMDSVKNVRHHNTKKDFCKRGHRLADPNLMKDRPRKRDCRSCYLARKSLRRRFSTYTELQLQELSDRRYVEFMPLNEVRAA